MKKHKNLQMLDDVKGQIDAYITMRALTDENPRKVVIEENKINAFKHFFTFSRFGHKTIEINVDVIQNKIHASLYENGLGLNTSRYQPLKKYKRTVIVSGYQGKRKIGIELKSPEEVQQLLNDINQHI